MGKSKPPLPPGERDGVSATFRAAARKASRKALETSNSALLRNGSRAFRARTGPHPTLSPGGRGLADRTVLSTLHARGTEVAP